MSCYAAVPHRRSTVLGSLEWGLYTGDRCTATSECNNTTSDPAHDRSRRRLSHKAV
jgi:hypothetical protein